MTYLEVKLTSITQRKYVNKVFQQLVFKMIIDPEPKTWSLIFFMNVYCRFVDSRPAQKDTGPILINIFIKPAL